MQKPAFLLLIPAFALFAACSSGSDSSSRRIIEIRTIGSDDSTDRKFRLPMDVPLDGRLGNEEDQKDCLGLFETLGEVQNDYQMTFNPTAPGHKKGKSYSCNLLEVSLDRSDTVSLRCEGQDIRDTHYFHDEFRFSGSVRRNGKNYCLMHGVGFSGRKSHAKLVFAFAMPKDLRVLLSQPPQLATGTTFEGLLEFYDEQVDPHIREHVYGDLSLKALPANWP